MRYSNGRSRMLSRRGFRLNVEPFDDRSLLSGYSFEPIATLGNSVRDSEFSDYFQIGGLNNRGDVAFGSNLPRPDDGSFRDSAILGRAGSFTVLALTGEPDPAGGAFGSGVLAPVSLNDRGDVVFAFDREPFALPIEPNSGLYRYTQGNQQLTAVVMPGMPAPGGGAFAGVGFGPHLDDRGDIAFAGVVPTEIGPGGESGLGVGLFVADPGDQFRAIARPGDSAPGGETFDWAAYPWNNHRGDIAFMGHVVEQGPSPSPEVDIFAASAGVYRYTAGTGRVELIARPGDPSPDGGAFEFTFFPRLNDRDLVFAAQTSAHPGAFGVFRESGGAVQALAVEGDPMPGGGHFAGLGVGSTTSNPISMNDRGDVTFLASLDTDDNRDGRADTGLFQWSHGALNVIARTGTDMPGIGTVRHVRQQDTAANDRDQAVFWARLTDRREVMILATPAGEEARRTRESDIGGAATVAEPVGVSAPAAEVWSRGGTDTRATPVYSTGAAPNPRVEAERELGHTRNLLVANTCEATDTHVAANVDVVPVGASTDGPG
jgi:hypothetical protein